MDIRDWHCMQEVATGRFAYYCWRTKEDFSGYVEVPIENWTADNYAAVLSLMMVELEEYKCERLPIMVLESARQVGVAEDLCLEMMKSLANKSFASFGGLM